MKKFNLIFSLLVIFCGANLNLYAQKKEISQKEFSDVYNAERSKTSAVNYRMISIYEAKRGSELNFVQTQKSISEFVRPNRQHYIWENRPINSDRTDILELIKIGDDEYEKRDNGEWKKRAKKLGQPINPSKNNVIQTSVKNFYLGKMDFSNQTADIYQREIESKHQRKNSATNELEEYKSNRIEKYWISKDGLRLKIETEETVLDSQPRILRGTVIYEYDPNIKIEAPIK